MAREIIDLSCDTVGPVTSDWYLDARGRSAGETISGNGQVVYSGLARWTAKLDFSLFRKPQVLAWRAAMAKMRGRVNILRVCVCDGHGPSYSEFGISDADKRLFKSKGVPFDGDVYFEQGVGFSFNPSASVAADASAGATSIVTANDVYGASIQTGRYFSIDDWLYICIETSVSGNNRTVSFEPPLRRAVTTDDRLELRASALMAFQSDTDGRLALSMGRRGSTSLDLVEWITRP